MRCWTGPCPRHTRLAAWGAWGGGAGRDGATPLLSRGADAAPADLGGAHEAAAP